MKDGRKGTENSRWVRLLNSLVGFTGLSGTVPEDRQLPTTGALYSGPDLESFPYQIAGGPATPTARAWVKAREYERRLAVYRWAEGLNEAAAPKYRVLLDDCESALLMTLEATIQFIGDQFENEGKVKLNPWLDSQPANTLLIRGLRTLRNLEAHVEARPATSLIIASVGGRPSIQRRWRLAFLEQDDLGKLRKPPLKTDDLPAWNAMVEGTPALELLERGLVQVVQLVEAAERELGLASP